MSLKDLFPEEVPEETVRMVEALLPVDSVYRLVADCVDEFLNDEQFADLYADGGSTRDHPDYPVT